MVRRIVLDTDMGSDVDDALCLALALASPEVELVAVTHVSRDTARRARISRRILDLCGHSDVPVFTGCAEPIKTGANRFVWFGHEGAGFLEGLEADTFPGEDSADALVRLFAEEEGLELVTVGPMTNVAEAARRDPCFPQNVSMLTVMGGHLREISYNGVVFPPGVDYNLCSDPDASLAVLRSGMPTRLVPSDVTLQSWLTPKGLRDIEEAGELIHRTLGAAVRLWTPVMRRIFSSVCEVGADNVAFLHDPLALASVFDESFCTFEDLAVEATVVDGVFRTLERPAASPGSFMMRCATAVDATRFHDYFVDRLVSLQASAP